MPVKDTTGTVKGLGVREVPSKLLSFLNQRKLALNVNGWSDNYGAVGHVKPPSSQSLLTISRQPKTV